MQLLAVVLAQRQPAGWLISSFQSPVLSSCVVAVHKNKPKNRV
jgi:hypothetical protein